VNGSSPEDNCFHRDKYKVENWFSFARDLAMDARRRRKYTATDIQLEEEATMLKKSYSKTGRVCRVTFKLSSEVGAEKAAVCGDVISA